MSYAEISNDYEEQLKEQELFLRSLELDDDDRRLIRGLPRDYDQVDPPDPFDGK